ncbi:aromatic acid exporter family protein [Aerococcaceae bacterium WGS1372]
MKSSLKANGKLSLGWRSIKTSIAVCITIIVYAVFNFGAATLAGLSAVFTLRETVKDSFLYARYRIFGNTIGVLIATGLIFLQQTFPLLQSDLVNSIFGGLGVLFVINLCTLTTNHQSVINSVATFLVVFLGTPEDTLVFYSIHRILDTVFGTIVAIIVNRLLPNTYSKN